MELQYRECNETIQIDLVGTLTSGTADDLTFTTAALASWRDDKEIVAAANKKQLSMHFFPIKKVIWQPVANNAITFTQIGWGEFLRLRRQSEAPLALAPFPFGGQLRWRINCFDLTSGTAASATPARQ